MPVIESKYKAKGMHKNMHYNTIFSNVFRKLNVTFDKRKRLELSDGDFIDLDWKFAKNPTKKVIVILHGFEGNTSSKYMLGIAKYGSENNYDVLAINFRGCNGEQNRLYKSYHAGSIEDLHETINYVSSLNKYNSIYINGFSLGGNILMLYLGSNLKKPKELMACMAVSSPCYLSEACKNQTKISNSLYTRNFLYTIKKKLKEKQKKFPNSLSKNELKKIKTLTDFDNIYTSKANGFNDAFDYYNKCSSYRTIDNIKTPTLLLNAKNDSFLSEKCYPFQKAKSNKYFYFESPKHGGHLGFYIGKNMTYSEKRLFDFFKSK